MNTIILIEGLEQNNNGVLAIGNNGSSRSTTTNFWFIFDIY